MTTWHPTACRNGYQTYLGHSSLESSVFHLQVFKAIRRNSAGALFLDTTYLGLQCLHLNCCLISGAVVTNHEVRGDDAENRTSQRTRRTTYLGHRSLESSMLRLQTSKAIRRYAA